MNNQFWTETRKDITKIVGLLSLCAVVAVQAGAETPPWMTPAVNSINRLPARAVAVPCESATKALMIARGDLARTESKWLQSLNGVWGFKWKHTVDYPNWEKEGQIVVPSCWQLQGDYDPALYVNSRFPIKDDGTGNPMLDPPQDYTSFYYRNPVGLYACSFAVPADWKGRRVVIHFGGVSSAMYVRLNGQQIGYSEDSRLPAEFDLTPHLKFYDGESEATAEASLNTLEVEVLKHCDGTFLECQDFWRLSGIFRDVWLVAEKKDAPKDLVVDAALADDYATGTLTVRDENGKVLLEKKYDKPRLWSCEAPNLYYETIEMDGDYRAVAFGFRKVEIKDSVIYINGKRALFKGTDRHEMQPEGGYTVTLEGMKRDLEIFHDLNINAVRTCHYPDDPTWYELCDREGIYVVCEANIESHGAGYGEKSYAKKPPFEASHVERGVNMVKTFRNHPSIVIWSMGNEAGDGPNFTAEYKAMRALDATRPIQYERAVHGANTDIFCPMYARPWDVENYVKNNPPKPLVLCEYTHAMGNSNGSVQDYWDLVRKYPSMQGGFVWDFVDQAIWRSDSVGTWLAYGGDFGDKPHDDNFNCNGLVDATREYHPGVYELKHAYQPVLVDAFDWETGEAKIYNGYRFLSLDDVTGWWTLERNGEKIAEEKLDLRNFAADTVKTVKTGARGAFGDTMTFRFYQNGREIAHDQFAKPFEPLTVEKKASAAPAAETEEVLTGDSFRVNLWRAPTDNDRGWNMPQICKVWKDATCYQTLPQGVEKSLEVTRLAAGRYLVEFTLTVSATNLPAIPRVGLTFTLPSDYTQVAWQGLGPWENYSDRSASACLGVYTATVGLVKGLADSTGTITYPIGRLNPDNYSEPGEQGYRTGCRWLELSNAVGGKVRITAVNAPFGFNAWPYSQLALERAKHQWDLETESTVTVNIDAVQMGVGGDDSWGARPHKAYMPGAGTYKLAFVYEAL